MELRAKVGNLSYPKFRNLKTSIRSIVFDVTSYKTSLNLLTLGNSIRYTRGAELSNTAKKSTTRPKPRNDSTREEKEIINNFSFIFINGW